jgi:hypothetical protein
MLLPYFAKATKGILHSRFNLYQTLKKDGRAIRSSLERSMVPGAGLEPARIYIRGILSPLRLPIPPPRRTNLLEAAPGFEPGIGVLQTPALPLGYAATRIISILINNKLF